jgi:predicted permease
MNLLKKLFQKSVLKREIDEELRFHIEQRTAENIAAGMSLEDAVREARKRFGNFQTVREQCRESRGASFGETTVQDVRFGLRMLRKNPGFAAVAVLTLALGIGANTAIFSLINAALLKALPVQNPRQLILLEWASRGGGPATMNGLEGNWSEEKGRGVVSSSFSMPYYEQARSQNHVFSDMLAIAANGSTLTVRYNGQPERASAELVSGTFFSTLGVQPILGRALTQDDDRVSASPAAVISYGYWQRRFGADSAVVGRTITVNGAALTIVGVSPPEFFGIQPGRAVEVWVPLHMRPLMEGQSTSTIFTDRDTWWVVVVGRLKPGVTAEMARADLELILQQNIASDVKSDTKAEVIPHIDVQPGSNGLSELRNQFSESLFILMTVVALVLLIACANVAGLLLARAASRQKEIAVRLAVGAPRGRLVRQLLTESLLLAGLGGAFGLLLAYWGSHLMAMTLAMGRDPVTLTVTPDLRVLGFAVLVSVLTAILFGLSPALRSTRVDLAPALKGACENSSDRMPSRRRMGLGLGQGLVALQVALSLVLLLGAGLFVRTLTNLEKVKTGFDARNLLLFGVDPTQDGFKDRRLAAFYVEFSRRLRLLPGVRSVSMSQATLISGGVSSLTIKLQGYVPKPGEKDDNVKVSVNWVGPNFFETLGIPLMLGRTLGETDRDETPRVAVVNQQFVRKYLGDANPLGRRLGSNEDKNHRDFEIVGVVGDAKFDSLRNDVPPTIYFALLQEMEELGSVHYEIRTVGNPMDMAKAVRQVAQEMNANLPLYDLTSQTNQIDQGLFRERLFAWLTSLFGALAGLLACIGIYGIVSFAVSRRTREFGVRIALGARTSHLFAMVIGQGMKVTAFGLVAGLALALAATRLMKSLLFGVTPADPWTFGTVTLMLIGVVFLACWLPARRATKVDPMTALRHE